MTYKSLNNKTRSRLYSIARPEIKSLSWGIVFLIISSLAGLVYPQLTRWLIDEVLTPKRLDLLLNAFVNFPKIHKNL